MYGALKCYNIRHKGGRQNTRHMKKKLITQSDDLIAQGVAKKLIRIGDDGKRIEYLRHGISRNWTKPNVRWNLQGLIFHNV